MGFALVRLAMRAAGATGLGAGAERIVDNRLDGPGAAAAFCIATEAAIDLFGVARKVRGSIHGIADVLVAEDVAGTDDHETGGPLGDAC